MGSVWTPLCHQYISSADQWLELRQHINNGSCSRFMWPLSPKSHTTYQPCYGRTWWQGQKSPWNFFICKHWKMQQSRSVMVTVGTICDVAHSNTSSLEAICWNNCHLPQFSSLPPQHTPWNNLAGSLVLSGAVVRALDAEHGDRAGCAKEGWNLIQLPALLFFCSLLLCLIPYLIFYGRQTAAGIRAICGSATWPNGPFFTVEDPGDFPCRSGG